MLIYIASPYTIGDQAENVRQQLIAGDKIIAMGHTPYCSLLTHFWHIFSPHDYETWMNIDSVILTRSDAVLRLPGESKGADREVAQALAMNKPVYYSLQEIG